jgi:hypothetical protein
MKHPPNPRIERVDLQEFLKGSNCLIALTIDQRAETIVPQTFCRIETQDTGPVIIPLGGFEIAVVIPFKYSEHSVGACKIRVYRKSLINRLAGLGIRLLRKNDATYS